VSRGKGGHHLDEATGKTEEHRPEGIGATPVDQVIYAGKQNIVGFLVQNLTSETQSFCKIKAVEK